jgi:hypothetical protein
VVWARVQHIPHNKLHAASVEPIHWRLQPVTNVNKSYESETGVDCSFRQTPVSILRDEIEVSRDQSKLDA